jgi:hypothetical protein
LKNYKEINETSTNVQKISHLFNPTRAQRAGMLMGMILAMTFLDIQAVVSIIQSCFLIMAKKITFNDKKNFQKSS